MLHFSKSTYFTASIGTYGLYYGIHLSKVNSNVGPIKHKTTTKETINQQDVTTAFVKVQVLYL